jgi:methionyl-tRNA synthetase
MMMHNADLADTLGNLVHRAANLSLRMCGGVVPDVPAEVIFDVARLRASTEEAFASLGLQAACELAINAVKDTNKYLTDAAPWNLKSDPHRQQVVVRSTLEAIYAAAHFLAPFIPAAAAVIFSRMGTPPRPLWKLGAGFDQLTVGTAVESGDILFAKFEAKAPEPAVPAAARKPAKQAAPAADAPVDVSRLNIRVGQILKVRQKPREPLLAWSALWLRQAAYDTRTRPSRCHRAPG